MNTLSMIPLASGDIGPFQTTLLGMGTVFVVLVILSLAIKIMTMVFTPKSEKKPEPKVVQQPAPVAEPVKEESSDDAIIAVITAAVVAASGGQKIVIQNIRRNGKALSTWSKMGVEETMSR